MNPPVAALLAVTTLGGLWLIVAGLIPVPESDVARGRDRLNRRLRAVRGQTPAQRRRRALLGAGCGAGVLIWLLTGWLLAVPAVPAAIVGLPVLLQTSADKQEIARLEAMSAWTRDLAGVIGAGIGIEQAIRTSLATVPPPIRAEVGRLVARIQARWETPDALRAWADDIDDATGDLIASALVLGAQRRGAQLAKVLTGLADTVADDVRMRRNVAAEQAKPRANARVITLITVCGLAFLFVTPYSEPYGTTLGQAVLAVYLSLYVGCLMWLRSITRSPRQTRILDLEVRQTVGGGLS
ncbi:type II secretion system F family protein [Phytoactinopolyspora mesophila]|uniref:Type II secretion system protein GspF domain-containing protein n=1 Tax=Phytoactinopolyspora mesophila TaxID=2650750 RepID=A0A7K3M147_9ACTN|nr:type II secretion system F family protein [Phytoactinopolyspora mesophila]NDL57025.1 hypothetical protein [Phytoactinopolyspora mesophila]